MDQTLHQLFVDHKGKITDKWNLYIEEDERIFAPYRDKPIRLLEIGVQNGGSLEIWSKYFYNAEKIIGCDIDPKCEELKFSDERISIVVGDVNENGIKQKILQKTDAFDIIIDDGSHKSSDIIRSFALYFPYLKCDGTYLVEDLHCSYWHDFEGGLHNPYSAISFFKRLADIVNYEHWRNGKSRNSLVSEFESKFKINFSDMDLLNIHSIEFINSLCIIKKLPAEKNMLGKRIIAGNEEVVTNDAKTLQHSFIQNNVPVVINDNDLDIFELIKHNEQLAKTIDLNNQDIQTLKTQISGNEQTLHERSKQIALKEETITSLQAQIAEHEQLIETLRSQLTEKEQALQDLGQQVASKNETIASLQAQIAEHEQLIETLRSQLTEKEKTFQDLGQQVASKDEAITSLQAQIAEHENSIQSLATQLENRDQQIQILNREIALYTNSTSWRITRPLRKISKKFRGGKSA